MAGRQEAILAIGSKSHFFAINARPNNFLAKIPFFGPFFAFDLGRKPRFKITVKYLGWRAPGDKSYNADVKPGGPVYDQNIVLTIDDEPLELNDDLPIDLHQIAYQMKEFFYLTRPFFLPKGGYAQLQVGLGEYPTVYSIEIKETSNTVVVILMPILAIIVGFFLGRIYG